MKKLSRNVKKSALTLIIGIGTLAYAYFFSDEYRPKQSETPLVQNITESLRLTHHAKCRMDCREITMDEVNGVWKKGKLNKRKSNQKAKPCPVAAKEWRSEDGQLIRGVFATCLDQVKVVTVIDLENEYKCNCR